MDLGVVEVVLMIALIIPALHVLISPRTRGVDRVAWLIATLALSWMAYTIWLAATSESRDRGSSQPGAS